MTKVVEASGDRYLARTSKVELLERERCAQAMLLIEFGSREAVESFYASADYAPYLKARQEGSEGRFLRVAGRNDFRLAKVPQ